MFGKKIITEPTTVSQPEQRLESFADEQAYQVIREHIYATIDPTVATTLASEALQSKLLDAVATIANSQRLVLTFKAQQQITQRLLDDMLGLGPLQALLDAPDITDILINGYQQIFIEQQGKLSISPYQFRDEPHLLHVARRIASSVGRHIDESSPMVDARLSDGSRVNIVISPLSLSGTTVSIRKFSRNKLSLTDLANSNSMSPVMAQFLAYASQSRLNILVSGGTGAGKTTLLNALSHHIDKNERIVTIEDAAELRLAQTHVITLESRPKSIEGNGEITLRDLLKNALRMRPDRIIVGEVRGEEAFEMMQAMNTGHDGSMSTLHANSARDALVRLENMLMMGQAHLPSRALRQQISSAIDIVVHIQRMRDGVRRVTNISEVTGLEGDTLVVQDLYSYQYQGELKAGRLTGEFIHHDVLPQCINKMKYFGLKQQVLNLGKST